MSDSRQPLTAKEINVKKRTLSWHKIRKTQDKHVYSKKSNIHRASSHSNKLCGLRDVPQSDYSVKYQHYEDAEMTNI